MKKMRKRDYLFIVPVIIFIGIFSLWPVIQSFTYTFFDYQLNDPQKQGLYLSDRFNYELFDETQLYLQMWLEEDSNATQDPEIQGQVDELISRIDEKAVQFEGIEGVGEIDKSDKEELLQLQEDIEVILQEMYEKYDPPHEADLPLIVDDIEGSLVPSNFIGLDGYKRALTDKYLHNSLINTLVFTIVSVFLELILGLALALIMNKAMFGQGLIRTTSLIPWAIPTAVAALIWNYLYDGGSGIVAHFFEMIGLIGEASDLLLTGPGAMTAAILADVWKTTPYMAILLLAGLQTIPKQLYEAAAIDGSSKVHTFFKITLPLLKPSILVALLFRTLDAFRVFDLIFVLTGGGPGGATETVSIYGYKIMFSQTNFGYGSVIVMIMFVCVAIIAILYVRVLGTSLMEKK